MKKETSIHDSFGYEILQNGALIIKHPKEFASKNEAFQSALNSLDESEYKIVKKAGKKWTIKIITDNPANCKEYDYEDVKKIVNNINDNAKIISLDQLKEGQSGKLLDEIIFDEAETAKEIYENDYDKVFKEKICDDQMCSYIPVGSILTLKDKYGQAGGWPCFTINGVDVDICGDLDEFRVILFDGTENTKYAFLVTYDEIDESRLPEIINKYNLDGYNIIRGNYLIKGTAENLYRFVKEELNLPGTIDDLINAADKSFSRVRTLNDSQSVDNKEEIGDFTILKTNNEYTVIYKERALAVFENKASAKSQIKRWLNNMNQFKQEFNIKDSAIKDTLPTYNDDLADKIADIIDELDINYDGDIQNGIAVPKSKLKIFEEKLDKLGIDYEEYDEDRSSHTYQGISFFDSKSVKDVKPRKGESKEDFISRFMEETKEEYPDQKQRLAVAYSYWERRNKKSTKDSKIKDSQRKVLVSNITYYVDEDYFDEDDIEDYIADHYDEDDDDFDEDSARDNAIESLSDRAIGEMEDEVGSEFELKIPDKYVSDEEVKEYIEGYINKYGSSSCPCSVDTFDWEWIKNKKSTKDSLDADLIELLVANGTCDNKKIAKQYVIKMSQKEKEELWKSIKKQSQYLLINDTSITDSDYSKNVRNKFIVPADPLGTIKVSYPNEEKIKSDYDRLVKYAENHDPRQNNPMLGVSSYDQTIGKDTRRVSEGYITLNGYPIVLIKDTDEDLVINTMQDYYDEIADMSYEDFVNTFTTNKEQFEKAFKLRNEAAKAEKLAAKEKEKEEAKQRKTTDGLLVYETYVEENDIMNNNFIPTSEGPKTYYIKVLEFIDNTNKKYKVIVLKKNKNVNYVLLNSKKIYESNPDYNDNEELCYTFIDELDINKLINNIMNNLK